MLISPSTHKASVDWVLHGPLILKGLDYNLQYFKVKVAVHASLQVFGINGYFTGIHSFAEHIQQDVYSPPLQNLCNGIHARQDKREEQELRHQTYL